MSIRIVPIPAFVDNYIWLIINEKTASAVCVDPGEAHPVLQYLQQQALQLSAILITHHHQDHTGGIHRLLKHYTVPVYGPSANTHPAINHALKHNEKFIIESLQMSFKVLEVPGHTLDHIAYLTDGLLFCGDTLFSAGCGRVFEGDAAMMYNSLQRIAQLPADTLIYPTHEYTLDNLSFAHHVEPDNPDIIKHQALCAKLRHANKPTLPTTLQTELAINPFLRCHQPMVRKAANQHNAKSMHSPVDTFATLRDWKNSYK